MDTEKQIDPSRLPDIEGEPLDFVWDTDASEGGSGTTVSHAGTVLWSDSPIWEGEWRFQEVRALPRERYGDRFRFLTPTRHSEIYLLGDHLGA